MAQSREPWSGEPSCVSDRSRSASYLVDGNISAARAFMSAFASSILASRPQLATPNTVSISRTGEMADDITITTDPLLNWAQLAVQTCQRAQGADNKPIREAWIRLCGTYQARGGPLAQPPVRQVRIICSLPIFNTRSLR